MSIEIIIQDKIESFGLNSEQQEVFKAFMDRMNPNNIDLDWIAECVIEEFIL